MASGRGRQAIQAALACAAVLAALQAVAAGGSTRAGPTARCRDGTYSYSLHHSGTCSHHGGVAAWLGGSTGPAVGAPASPVAAGHTVLLAPRTRTARCKLGPKPDRACSPGAFSSGLTKAVICSPAFRTSAIRNVPQSEKYAVEAEYGLAPRLYGSSLEIDHIVSLELGGSNDIANLFPERLNAHPGYRVKDRLENRLHTLVCVGGMSLRGAQRAIAGNWEQLYRDVFGTTPVI